MSDMAEIERLQAEVVRLTDEAANLRTVMVAAAEEIHAHWSAHCDADGYGPTNLMTRLERGIAAQYRYKTGDFARLHACLADLDAKVVSLTREAARMDYVRKAFLLDDDDALADFYMAETVAEFNAAIDGVLVKRTPIDTAMEGGK